MRILTPARTAFILLVVESAATALAVRLSRTVATDTRYLTSTAIVMSEMFKLVVSAILLQIERKESTTRTVQFIYTSITSEFRGTMLFAIPAGLYTIQNNLRFYGLGKLDADGVHQLDLDAGQ